MSKLTNVRERIHQPFRDSLIRASGWNAPQVQATTPLFTGVSREEARTNLQSPSQLPSDQSMCVLALRVGLHFRNSLQRGSTVAVAGGTNYPSANGDFQFNGAASTWDANQSNITAGQAAGSTQDVHRLYYQAEEQLFWTFGAGDKPSMSNMPSSYFPWGGGLHGDLGGSTNLIYWNNGMPTQESILRLARAILIPPRQQIRCIANIYPMTAGGNEPTFNLTQQSRNMLSLVDNLNAIDGINKVITFCFDGLLSRDVQ